MASGGKPRDPSVSTFVLYGGKCCAELVGAPEFDDLDANGQGAAGILKLFNKRSGEWGGCTEEVATRIEHAKNFSA